MQNCLGELELLYVRMSIWHFKDGKRGEAFPKIDNTLEHSVQRTHGFRGFMTLLSDDDSNKLTVLTFWKDIDSLKASEKGVLADTINEIEELIKGKVQVTNYNMYSSKFMLGPE
jgi:heme-degrading monooxygenase HmoA